MQCVAECQCPNGLFRTKDDKCVKQSKCPKDKECKGDLQYKECGTACPKKCGEEPKEMCTRQCVAGCQCPFNMWETKDGRCVEDGECGVQDCEGDLVFNKCGTACPLVCGEEKPEFCTKNCVAECQCPKGQWMTEDNACVAEDECDSKKVDAEFDDFAGYQVLCKLQDKEDECLSLGCGKFKAKKSKCFVPKTNKKIKCKAVEDEGLCEKLKCSLKKGKCKGKSKLQ